MPGLWHHQRRGGKRVLGIRVVRLDSAGPLGWTTALLRNPCRIVSALPLLLGYLWMLWDKEKMTWHDKLSKTVVVCLHPRIPRRPAASDARPPREPS